MIERWQGVEIEYAIPYGGGGDLSSSAMPSRDLMRGLASYRFPGGGGPFLDPQTSAGGFLVNGGRAYVDHVVANDVFEVCTPEAQNARAALCYERALDTFVAQASEKLYQDSQRRVHAYKTATAYDLDGNITTRGFHESYLIKRASFERCVGLLVPFMSVRGVFCGAGGYHRGQFVLSTRMFSMGCIISNDLPRDRPFIAGGKEPLTGPDYFRLHLCTAEGARCDWTAFLRQAITTYVVAAIEEGILTEIPRLADPVAAAAELSAHPDGDWELTLKDGSRMGAVDYLRQYYVPPIERLFEVGQPGEDDWLALNRFKQVLDALERCNFGALSRTIDWLVKLDIFEKNVDEYFELDEGSPAERQGLDFQFKAVTDPFYEEMESDLGIERLIGDEDVEKAMRYPPPESRGSLRVALARNLALAELEWDRAVVNGGRVLFTSLDGWKPQAVEDFVGELKRQGQSPGGS